MQVILYSEAKDCCLKEKETGPKPEKIPTMRITEETEVLILSHSRVARDPRVLRQISWLYSLGFRSISTVGVGRKPDGIRQHLEIRPRGTFARVWAYLFLRKQARFDFLFGRQLNRLELAQAAPSLLIIVNEVEYLPWPGFFGVAAMSKPTYLDLHEDHSGPSDRTFLERLAFRRYNDWVVTKLIGFVSSRKTLSITTVSGSIAESAMKMLSHDVHVITNAPARNNLQPSQTDPSHIKLIHHGMGSAGKGIEIAIRALKYLPKTYTLTLLLFASPTYLFRLKLLAKFQGVASRVHFLRGVPLKHLHALLNSYDIEVMPFGAATKGYLNALPNKLFEAIHSKIAVVSGPNFEMRRLVESHAIGVASQSSHPVEVADAIMLLDLRRLEQCKRNTVAASDIFNEEANGDVFMALISSLAPR